MQWKGVPVASSAGNPVPKQRVGDVANAVSGGYTARRKPQKTEDGFTATDDADAVRC